MTADVGKLFPRAFERYKLIETQVIFNINNDTGDS